MSILKHSNKHLLALFISNVFFVIIIQGAPIEQTNELGSIPASEADLNNIYAHKSQKIFNYDFKNFAEVALTGQSKRKGSPWKSVLDAEILDIMYESHLKGRLEAKTFLQRAVIVGGGPHGLYAAFQLFLVGIKVVLVNDEKEEYIRNQFIRLDNNYMSELKTLLGTAFVKLFKQEESPGSTDKDGTGFINLKFFENAMKESLETLAKYVAKRPNEKGDSLKLIYRQSVEKIQFPTAENPQYFAVLKHTDPKKVDDTTLVPFDLLVCAGGTKDKIRDTYLGIPKELSVPQKYGVGLLLKGEQYKYEKFQAGLKKSMGPKETERFLKNKGIEKYISESLLLSQPTKKLYDSINTDQLYNPLKFWLYENKYSVNVAQPLDPSTAKFLDAIENEKNKPKNREKRAKYDDIKFNIVKRFLAAIAHQYINVDRKESKWVGINMEDKRRECMLNFDPYPVNTTTFDFVQQALDSAAVQYHMQGKSAIVLAVGDSAVNSHFYASAGLELGRVGIHQAADLIEEYKQGTITNKYHLVKKLNENHRTVKEKLLYNNEKYTKRLVEKKTNDIAQKAMSLAIRDMARTNTSTNYGFKAKTSEESKAIGNDVLKDFKIVVDYSARVTDEGQIQVENGPRFDTVVQAAMWLKDQKTNVL